MLTPAAILETALYAPDLDAAQEFYETVLNLDLLTRAGDRHAFFKLERGILLLFNPAQTAQPSQHASMPVPPHGATGPGHLCFAASRDQINEWRDRLNALGVRIEAEFDWPNGARSLYFRDPAGNSLEFAEPRLWGF
ncbi:VOC family protein [Thalassovita sp.]|jgi:catechol 2,3-dioxygenase-like lactoylglutathione lyase family enzyme|uniref:VOC family protein n=1 Tax=Thalassovita sp. TaxID=1979401 RepID=UPI003B59D895